MDDGSDIADSIARWKKSGAAERANCQLFISELCDLLALPHPDPTLPDDSENAYVFERAVKFAHGGNGRIDLYKRDCFVLEAKQGSDPKAAEELPLFGGDGKATKPAKKGTAVRGTGGWDDAMVRARGQAEGYAKALPVEEGWPPFLIVVDVGHCIELFADFARSGKAYTQFPDAASFRVGMDDLARPEIRERLMAVWSDPLALDPARRSARVTRDIADRLARLAKSLEATGRAPESVAQFLMRCLFTMFAEDVELLPKNGFTELLESLEGQADKFHPMAKSLWETMDSGGFSPILRDDLLRFNGGLFENSDAIPIDEEQLALLAEAARADWQDVEPAIFGTLLERALDARERHKLGAHYTPRAYVERLVMPAVIEPLREDWTNIRTSAVMQANAGKVKEALDEVRAFHRTLCNTRVLDPACGSGNFLYVTLEHMKRLEGEVVDLAAELGEDQYFLEMDRHTVDPHQFLGIEINPRAAVIAELVLWIGYLQWHFRTRGRTMPAQPVLRNFHNIECRDAVLDWDEQEIVRHEDGKPVTRWDGRTTKPSPVTGEEVPDETARIETYRYTNPRPAQWPEADFVVGNPPFIGNKRMRMALGDGYVEALRQAWKDVPNSADYVMYWWHKAAGLVREGKATRFGLITTNSLGQAFNRRIVQRHLEAKMPLSLVFAIPDHPWVDTVDGAAVRISMIVGQAGQQGGQLAFVRSEGEGDVEGVEVELDYEYGKVHSDLKIGADVTSAVNLAAASKLSTRGVIPHGSGFVVSAQQARDLGLGRDPSLDKHIRPYRNGKDITDKPRHVLVIDLHGMSEDAVRENFPKVYQWLYDRVRPERAHNKEPYRRLNWWLFARKNSDLRKSIRELCRYIATPQTSKHRFFIYLDVDILPDDKLIAIALERVAFNWPHIRQL